MSHILDMVIGKLEMKEGGGLKQVFSYLTIYPGYIPCTPVRINKNCVIVLMSCKEFGIHHILEEVFMQSSEQ